MRIVTDLDACISAGMCVLTEPAVFTQSEDLGTVVVTLEGEVPAELVEGVRRAVNLCPSGALSLAE
jgi:ferredoxin